MAEGRVTPFKLGKLFAASCQVADIPVYDPQADTDVVYFLCKTESWPWTACLYKPRATSGHETESIVNFVQIERKRCHLCFLVDFHLQTGSC